MTSSGMYMRRGSFPGGVETSSSTANCDREGMAFGFSAFSAFPVFSSRCRHRCIVWPSVSCTAPIVCFPCCCPAFEKVFENLGADILTRSRVHGTVFHIHVYVSIEDHSKAAGTWRCFISVVQRFSSWCPSWLRLGQVAREPREGWLTQRRSRLGLGAFHAMGGVVMCPRAARWGAQSPLAVHCPPTTIRAIRTTIRATMPALVACRSSLCVRPAASCCACARTACFEFGPSREDEGAPSFP